MATFTPKLHRKRWKKGRGETNVIKELLFVECVLWSTCVSVFVWYYCVQHEACVCSVCQRTGCERRVQSCKVESSSAGRQAA